MQCRSVVLIGSTPSFVHTLGRIVSAHGYDVVFKAWTDDMRSTLTDPPLVMVLDGSELITLGWSLIGWVNHDPVARYIPVLVCSDQLGLLPYSMRALQNHPGPIVASSLDRGEFLAKLSALQSVDTLLERVR